MTPVIDSPGNVQPSAAVVFGSIANVSYQYMNFLEGREGGIPLFAL